MGHHLNHGVKVEVAGEGGGGGKIRYWEGQEPELDVELWCWSKDMLVMGVLNRQEATLLEQVFRI